MQLNRYIPNEDLPPVLLRPLKFGDTEQIKALYELDAKIEAIEDVDATAYEKKIDNNPDQEPSS